VISIIWTSIFLTTLPQLAAGPPQSIQVIYKNIGPPSRSYLAFSPSSWRISPRSCAMRKMHSKPTKTKRCVPGASPKTLVRSLGTLAHASHPSSASSASTSAQTSHPRRRTQCTVELTQRGLELRALEIEQWVNFGDTDAQPSHNESTKRVQIPEEQGEMALALWAKLVAPSK
jgi:hypothetical protein